MAKLRYRDIEELENYDTFEKFKKKKSNNSDRQLPDVPLQKKRGKYYGKRGSVPLPKGRYKR